MRSWSEQSLCSLKNQGRILGSGKASLFSCASSLPPCLIPCTNFARSDPKSCPCCCWQENRTFGSMLGAFVLLWDSPGGCGIMSVLWGLSLSTAWGQSCKENSKNKHTQVQGLFERDFAGIWQLWNVFLPSQRSSWRRELQGEVPSWTGVFLV